MLRHLLMLAFAVLLGSGAATAQTFPKFTGFVVDTANVIPPDQEAALTKRLDDLQKTTGNQLVVATVPDLEGYPIEDYGNALLRNWGVGLEDANNGAIVLVATLAGLLASVLPARRAARTAPVAAIAG